MPLPPPPSSNSPSADGALSLQGVYITVENSTLHGVGDVLVVKTTPDSPSVITMKNISIELQNVVVSSSTGSAASIVTLGSGGYKDDDVVTGCRIRIGGNTTVQARYLAGSIQTSRLVNSSLILGTSMESDDDFLHLPVSLVAGGTHGNGVVGVMAILPSRGPAIVGGSSLHVEDVHILVESSADLLLTATVKTGQAVVAGIAIRHASSATLTMTGTVAIEVKQRRFLAATSFFEESLSHVVTLRATASLVSSTAVVGGVALLAFDPSTSSVSEMQLQNCTLRLLFFSTSSFSTSPDAPSATTTAVSIQSSALDHYSACTAFGVAINSYAKGLARNSLTINGKSSVHIGCRVEGSGGGVDALAQSTRSRVASSLLGVAINSYTTSSTTTNILHIDDLSQLIIEFITEGNMDVTLRALSSHNRLSSAVLGVAVNGVSLRASSSGVSVGGSSTLAIGCTISGGGKVSLQAPTKSSNLASTVLGVAVSSNGDSDSICSLALADSSSLGIACSIIGTGNATMEASSIAAHVTSSVAGIAMNSYTDSVRSPSRSTLTIDRNSTVTIACSTQRRTSGGILAMLVPSTNTNGVASAVLGAALNSNPLTSSFTIDDSSALHIQALLTQGAVVRASVEDQTSVAAAVGVVLRGHDANTALKVVTTQTEGASTAEVGARAMAVDIWVGMQTESQLSVVASTGAALGLMAVDFGNLNSQNTALALCRDDKSDPPLASDGGVAMATSPTIPGLEVQHIVGWQIIDEQTEGNGSFSESDGNQQPLSPSSSFFCDKKVVALEALLRDTMPDQLPPPSVPTTSPSLTAHSTPSSRSLSTASPTLTFSHRTGTLYQRRTPPTRTSSATAPSTITLTQQVAETPSPPTSSREPPTPTPTSPTEHNTSDTETPRKRTVRITTSVLLPDNEVAATVVLSTAGASSAVASTLGSSGAGMVIVAGSSVRMMECGLAEDDPRPASFELPIQFAVGNGLMRYFAGAALAHTLLQCIMFGASVILQRRQHSVPNNTTGGKVVQIMSMVFCGAHPFFTPGILGACSTVLFNDDDNQSVAVAACSALVVATIHGVVVLAVHRGPANGLVTRRVRSIGGGGKAKLEFKVCRASDHTTTTSSGSSSNSSSDERSTSTTDSTTTVYLLFSGHATKGILLTLFDGCRIFEKATHRHYASIETTLYSIIAIISGARPQNNCSTAAFAIGVLAALQLIYVVAIRPFRTKLDTIFSVLNGAVLLILSMAVAISVRRRSSSDELVGNEDWVLKTVEVCLWLISVLGFVQLGVQGYWAYHVHQRRLQFNEQSSGDSSIDDDDSSTDDSADATSQKKSDDGPHAEPLLVAVEMEKKNATTTTTATIMSSDDDEEEVSVAQQLNHNPLLQEAI